MKSNIKKTKLSKIKKITVPDFPEETPKATTSQTQTISKKWYKKPYTIAITTCVIIFAFLWYWFIIKDLPSPRQLGYNQIPVSTKIFDRHGILLYEVYADQNRTLIKLSDLPEYVKQATIAIEDKDFYTHPGVDILGMIRGASRLITRGRAQGGSTITQQLVKNALLTSERSLIRKIKELILTISVESLYSKDEILEMYLNQIPYGGTAYGIESAAQTYFNKHAKDLTLAESTVLAGLPQAPTRYSPFGTNPDSYKTRQKAVVDHMVENHFLTSEQANAALSEKLTFSTPKNLISAPHFVLWVKDLLIDKYGVQQVESGGLRVTTTLDLSLQEAAQASLSAQIAKLEKSHVTNGAALVTNPVTGEVLSMIGSTDYFNKDIGGNVNVTLSYRQPGSSIKPLNYTLAFYQQGLSPGNIIADLPTCFLITGQPPYCPQNYSGGFSGGITIRAALANSYNIPAVKLLALNGMENFITQSKFMGITGWDDPSHYGLSLTLGGGEVRMIDLATAYGTIDNLGVKVPLNPILEVSTYQGKMLEQHTCTPPDLKSLTQEDSELNFSTDCNATRILPPGPPYLTYHILSDQNARAPTFGSLLNIPNRPDVAVKTGTTNSLHDNWTVGFSANRLTAVWVGNNDNSPMSHIASGVTGAAPIWRDIMRMALVDQPKIDRAPPEGIIGTQICAWTGMLPIDGCPTTFDLYQEGHLPQASSPITRPWPIDVTTNSPETKGTLPENRVMQDHPIVFDIFGTAICRDCPVQTQNQSLRYPLDISSSTNQ